MTALVNVRKQIVDNKSITTVLIAPGTERPYSCRQG